MGSISGMFNTSGTADIGIEDLKPETIRNVLRAPQKNILKIQRMAKFMTNKHGILKEALRVIKTTPDLKYHLNWGLTGFDDPKIIKENEETVYKFFKDIKLVKMIRDGLWDLAESGTLVVCNRKNKYIQFLELDNIVIESQINGRWVVKYDLSKISKKTLEAQAEIANLPDEVTMNLYNRYKKNPSPETQFVHIKSAHVLSLDANRNSPFGLPYTFASWSAIMQKEMMDKVERSISDRMMKQILVLTAGKIGDTPAPQPLIDAQFKSISNMLSNKQNNKGTGKASDHSGTGLVAFADIFNLQTLKLDVTFYPKEMYDKVKDEVYANIGMSEALIHGGGKGNFASAELNSKRIAKYVQSVLELFEYVINDFIADLLPKDAKCEFYFEPLISVSQAENIQHKKELYLQTSIVTPYLEAISGRQMHHLAGMKKYEDAFLDSENLFTPPANAHTLSGSPEPNSTSNLNSNTNSNPTNSNTIKSLTNGANNVPSPSDS